MTRIPLNPVERRLVDSFQRNFPLIPRPFRILAETLRLTEGEVLHTLGQLAKAAGVVNRVGPVFRPHGIGSSTLAALRVPPERLEAVAACVSAYEEVNHNYEREHTFNLWFVITAATPDRLARVLEDIAHRTGCEMLNLPLVHAHHIDLGFPLAWN
ncbi:MAG: AsnC family transcriptional regulator [Rhodospirillaceae bacterium]|nr:MAG: AsnC family transcriptional regulator [Rhodospirillaceae bacterium]